MKISKIVLVILCCLLLSGCMSQKQTLKEELLANIKVIKENKLPKVTNNEKKYFRFNLPAGLGKIESDTNNNIFNLDNYPLVMNLNIAQILNDRYYYNNQKASLEINPTTPSDEVVDLTFQINDYLGNPKDCHIKATLLSNDRYYLQIGSNYLDFGCVVPKTMFNRVIDVVFHIIRTSVIDFDGITVAYTNKELENNTKHDVSLFTQIAPQDGLVSDIVNGGTINPDLIGSGGMDSADQ
ncbi:MAG: hypothetical protein WBO70_03955 [Erysipelotrichaceae bacterium]